MEYDWCNPNDLSHLNMVNDIEHDSHLCFKDAQNQDFVSYAPMIFLTFDKCDEAKLEEGQKCLNKTELDKYVKSFVFQLGVLHSYIDYDNIEEPVQTIYQPKQYYRLSPYEWYRNKFYF